MKGGIINYFKMTCRKNFNYFKNEMKGGIINYFKMNCRKNCNTILNEKVEHILQSKNNLLRNCLQLYMKRTLSYIHLQTFLDQQPEK